MQGYFLTISVVRFVVNIAKNFDMCHIIDGAGGDDFTTPLWNAAKFGHFEIAKILFNNGANLNAKDKSGNTPLHIATKNGHSKVIQEQNDNNIILRGVILKMCLRRWCL